MAKTSERMNWPNALLRIVPNSSIQSVSNNTIQRNYLSTLMPTQCISDVLFITVTLVESAVIRCQFINVFVVQRLYIQDVWTRKKLQKYPKSILFVKLTLKTKKIWRKLKTDFRLKLWKSSSKLKNLRLRKKKNKKFKLLKCKVQKSKKKTKFCTIIQQEETEGEMKNLWKIWALNT